MFDSISTPDNEHIVSKISALTEDNLYKLSCILDEMLLKQDICHLVNSSNLDFGQLIEIKTAVMGECQKALVQDMRQQTIYPSPTRDTFLNAPVTLTVRK